MQGNKTSKNIQKKENINRFTLLRAECAKDCWPLLSLKGVVQKKEEETDFKMTEVCLVKLLLDVARRVRLEVDSNKTDKN